MFYLNKLKYVYNLSQNTIGYIYPFATQGLQICLIWL